MKIDTARFGELDVNPETILTFPKGLAGFAECTRFQLLYEEGGEGPVVFILQSLDDPALTLSVVDPTLFGFNYEITLSDEEVALLQVGDPSEVAVLLIVYKPQGGGASSPVLAGGVAANINGPLVLNPGKKLGLQKVLLGPQCDITLREGGR